MEDDMALFVEKPSDSQLVSCLCKYFSASVDMWCSDFIVHKPHTCGRTHMLRINTHTQTLRAVGGIKRRAVSHVF